MALLVTGAIALGRKVSDDRAKKRELKQGLLSVGSSDVAKRAFANQTTRTLQDGGAGLQRAGTDIKFEDPSSLDVSSPATSTPIVGSLENGTRDGTTTPISSPKDGNPASLAQLSPAVPPSIHTRDSRSGSVDQHSQGPPPYSPRRDAPPQTPSSVYSQDVDQRTLNASDSSSFVSNDGTALKVRTKGADLKSGFPYHPALFDLKVRPDLWDQFTHQVVETTKFSAGDHAKMWAAATATACTGAIVTSVFVGRFASHLLSD